MSHLVCESSAAVIGESIRYFTGIFIFTFLVATVWIYVANYCSLPVNEARKKELGYRVFRLKHKRHVRWFMVNIFLILGGVFCYLSEAGYGVAVGNLFWKAGSLIFEENAEFIFFISDNLFNAGILIIYL